MIDTSTTATLIAAVSDLKEDAVLNLVRRRLAAGDDPLRLIEACQEGMRQVGLRYERREYYLAGLIMAGEIFSGVTELLRPVVERQISDRASGRILLGTVKGDIHDLGKNMVNVLLSCHHFAIKDLGVDVSPDAFVAQGLQIQPHVVGLSGLLTSAYDAMRETVSLLRAEGYQGPIIIGGGQISAEVCEYVGADHWTTDGVAGVELCKRLVEESTASGT
ncbi:MAG: cobalamin-dependent protein [Anaerolineae bacterium]|jgi:methanogenic corrinoid protein MtbC1